MKERKALHFILSVCGITVVLLLGMAVLTIVVDPYFHYHKPFSWQKYRLYEERYINDGISRHFDYDAVIIGNSLTENFKTSEFDSLFNVNSIKIPASGAGYKEIWETLNRAFHYNPNIKTVVSALDYDDLSRNKDWIRYQDYPDYLYDDNPLNDASYLWNKEVFYRGTLYNMVMTLKGMDSTDFDEYGSWVRETGKEKVMSLTVDDLEVPPAVNQSEYTKEKEDIIRDNIRTNIVPVVAAHPDTQFYLYFSPVNIAQWYIWETKGQILRRIGSEQTAIEELLQYDNVHLYCFLEKTEWTCDLNHYSDTIHYTPEINSAILQLMKNGEYEITKENYREHIQRITEFYGNYDYSVLDQ